MSTKGKKVLADQSCIGLTHTSHERAGGARCLVLQDN